MGDFDFGGGNFGDIEKVKNIKGKYDALIAKMFATGYSNEIYKEYIDIKSELSGINPQIVQESGINMAILDVIEQKHQEEIKKQEALKQEIDSFNKNYVNILETFILEHDESIKDEIKKYKAKFSKLPKESKPFVYNNDDVFKAISDSFDVQEENDEDAKDVSGGLDLTKEDDRKEYLNRLVIPFAKQLVDRVHELIDDDEETFDKDDRLIFREDGKKTFFHAITKAPKQIKDGSVNIDDLDEPFTFDEINGYIVYEPEAWVSTKLINEKRTSAGWNKTKIQHDLSYEVLIDEFTKRIISTANNTLNIEDLHIDYGWYYYPKYDNEEKDWFDYDNNDYKCTHRYIISLWNRVVVDTMVEERIKEWESENNRDWNNEYFFSIEKN